MTTTEIDNATSAIMAEYESKFSMFAKMTPHEKSIIQLMMNQSVLIGEKSMLTSLTSQYE